MKPDKPLIVYVDDDEEDRSLLSDAISMAAPEYDITTIEDGYTALEFLHASKDDLPCLVIVDLNMPGMNGKELIASIRKNEAFDSLPIVAFTTSSSYLDKTECARYGVDMITKPITFTELKETVKQLTSYCKTEV
jgi:CheY-like chemotaxis protein